MNCCVICQTAISVCSPRRILCLRSFLCLAALQCCCTVNRFSAVNFTSHNLQNKIIPSVVKYFTPKSLTKPRNLTLSEHFTSGTLKVSGVPRGGFGGGSTPHPPKFRRYRWSPPSHEQEEPASRFPSAVHCVLIRL